jgi:hypothetical protein
MSIANLPGGRDPEVIEIVKQIINGNIRPYATDARGGKAFEGDLQSPLIKAQIIYSTLTTALRDRSKNILRSLITKYP